MFKTLIQSFFGVLEQIDQDPSSYSLNRQQALRRTLTVLASVCFCLLLINYLKYSTTLTSLLKTIALWQSHQQHTLISALQQSGFYSLFCYAWWTFWHVIGYVLLPFLVLRFILKQPFLSMGWHFNDTAKHWRAYLLLLSPILVGVFFVSQGKAFVEHYPFYKLAGRSWFDLLAWESLYLLQFICLEFFFRGFMLHSLRPALGVNAIWIMCVPYLMIHFPKLALEATGAIFFGLFLGILAFRSRSIWGGFFVHAGVAVSMDIAALIKQGYIPKVWWPF